MSSITNQDITCKMWYTMRYMVTEFAPTRRNFLGLDKLDDYMESRRGRQRSQPQPRRNQPVQPQGGGWHPGRRDFLIAGAAAVGAAILRPWDWLRGQLGSDRTVATPRAVTTVVSAENPYMPDGAIKLGREINAWRVGRGVSTVQTFPEIKQAADLLEGKVDPRQYIPQLKVPVEFVLSESEQAFSFKPEFDLDSSRKVRVRTNKEEEFTLPFLKPNCVGSLKFSPDVLNSSMRLPIAAKEASQIVDHLEYCKAYVALLRENGSFTLENPDNIATTEEEFIISIAWAQLQVELDRTGVSWFHEFVDIGSGLRVGGIAFANWYEEQVRSGRQPVQDVNFRTGSNLGGFLQAKNYISERNGMWVWTTGEAPEIGSKRFLNMFNDYTGRELV